MSAFLKSTFITNRDAVPKVLTDSYLAGGILSDAIGSVKTGASDTANSYYRLISVPSNARVCELKYQTEGLGSGCIIDVAAWYPTQIPVGGANFLAGSLAGTIISSSAFGSSGITAPAANALTEVVAGNIALQETPLWNILGLTSDPEIDFDLGFVTRVATASAGYVGLRCKYQY